MNRIQTQWVVALLFTMLVGACETSTEPYSRGGTGYRYVVPDSPERALGSLKRWSNPKTIINFHRPSTPNGHRVNAETVEVTEHEIKLAGEREIEDTYYRLKPGYEVAEIPFSSILLVKKETLPIPPMFWIRLVTDEGEYILDFYNGTTRNRFADALEIYLPYVQ